jgi:hypothetical protein
MKTLGRLLLLVLVVGAVAFGVWYFTTQRQVELVARSGGTDGGLQWAYSLALPQARTATGMDALLVEAEADHLLPDGRLAANVGEWRLSFSSFSANKRVVVTVNHLGTVTVGGSTAPGTIHAVGSPPGTFPNSIPIFAATVGRGASGTRTVVNPTRLAYDSVAGAHLWFITYRVNGVNETHKVRWDSVWLSVSS